MEKVIRDGMVAILYSPGYGAGWSSWSREHEDILLFHPKLVKMVEKGDAEKITEDFIKKELGIDYVCCGGVNQLVIEWLPEGTPFLINEYDGSESVETSDSFTNAA